MVQVQVLFLSELSHGFYPNLNLSLYSTNSRATTNSSSSSNTLQ
jgi:hypothetical protein